MDWMDELVERFVEDMQESVLDGLLYPDLSDLATPVDLLDRIMAEVGRVRPEDCFVLIGPARASEGEG